MNRRKFLKQASIGLLLPVAPAIVRAEWIMPVKPVILASPNRLLTEHEIGKLLMDGVHEVVEEVLEDDIYKKILAGEFSSNQKGLLQPIFG